MHRDGVAGKHLDLGDQNVGDENGEHKPRCTETGRDFSIPILPFVGSGNIVLLHNLSA